MPYLQAFSVSRPENPRQRTRQPSDNHPGNRPLFLCDPLFGKFQLAAFFLGQLHKSIFVAGQFVAGNVPFPAPLPAIPGEHPRIGERLPARHHRVHDLVDIVQLPPFRLVIGVAQRLLEQLFGADHAAGVVFQKALYLPGLRVLRHEILLYLHQLALDGLKSLTRYRFDKVQERAKLKTSISRLVNILFPELEKLVPSLHMVSIYALLAEFPSSAQIASCHLTRLTNLLANASKGHYNKEKAIEIRNAAKHSIGSNMPAKSLELKHTIRLIQELTSEIDEIECSIKSIMDEIRSPILSIPGINYRMGAMIIAEIGDFNRFSSPDKILAYAGLSPSTYQSGQLDGCYSHMEKRGSRYLRYALFNATKFVCIWDNQFSAYLAKKRSEGKHYNVAISHAAKKLVRVIYQLEKSGQLYHRAA